MPVDYKRAVEKQESESIDRVEKQLIKALDEIQRLKTLQIAEKVYGDKAQMKRGNAV